MPYYLHDGQNSLGPFEPTELVQRPGFDADTMVFPLGSSSAADWKPARSFHDIAEALKAPHSAAPPAPAPAAKKLVLIVEDDEGLRSFLELSVTKQGFAVVLASNGHEAAEKLAQRPADLIVTDLMMPGQGGYEFLRSLHSAGAGQVPVIVLTGVALESSTVHMIRQESNVVEFFSKPVRMPAFAAALHRHLQTAPR